MSKNRENRKHGRLRLEQPLRVVMRSIGGQVMYEMTTCDVSSHGFFLSHESPGRFPFNRQSIMEVWMELEGDKTVFFNGKMARVVMPTGRPEDADIEPGIAIRIVQIDRGNEKILKDFIEVKMATSQDDSEEVA